MGVAEGRGVHVVLPQGSTLLADPKELYGYESHDADGRLVESYRRRTWFRPFGTATTDKAPAPAPAPGAIEPIPAEIADEIARERLTNPPPAEWVETYARATPPKVVAALEEALA